MIIVLFLKGFSGVSKIRFWRGVTIKYSSDGIRLKESWLMTMQLIYLCSKTSKSGDI